MDERIKRDSEDALRYYDGLIEKMPDAIFKSLKPDYIEFDREGGRLLYKIPTKPWMRNSGNVAHGGVIAAIIDNVMGSLSNLLAGQRTPTINININLMRAVRLDEPLCVEAVCEKRGNKLTFIRCRGYNDSAPAKTLFTAESSFLNP